TINTPRIMADQLRTTFNTFPQLKSSSFRYWFFWGLFLRGRGSFRCNFLSFILIYQFLVGQPVDRPEIPYFLGVIETVADDKDIGNPKPNIINGNVDFQSILLI